ncbi:serpin (serine protease inhibitor) domain-containing protein [Ditylenchus destructor]|uniref:Serpin (Serine protease inhibitor) domain-containing protein n=1 Tax=Ditylenchus destructor TaxID=166010 RepID=A0AAD4MNP4_9BILA|nr:serpin (serine protease inhibitor) domain-containing protein [Ditylenchus destructor]
MVIFFTFALIFLYLDHSLGALPTNIKQELEPIYKATSADQAHDIWNDHLIRDKQYKELDQIWTDVDNQRSDLTAEVMEYLHKNEMKDKSFVMASTSLFIELAMVCLGAGGETLKQCNGILGKGAPAEVIHVIYHMISKHQMDQTNTQFKLRLLNLIYVDKTFPLKKDCEEGFNKIFAPSEIHNVSFATHNDVVARAKDINDQGRNHCEMEQLVTESELENTVMLLISAVRFSGKWVTPFPKVEDQKFTNEKGEVTQVRMMTGIEQEMIYDETDDYQMVALPYNTSGEEHLAPYLVIYLPKEHKTVTQVLEKLKSGGKLVNTFQGKLTSYFGKELVKLSIPEIAIDNKVHLEDAMKALGFKNGFSAKGPNKADFKNLSEKGEETYISAWWQDIFIKVDKTGTEGGTNNAQYSGMRSARGLAPPKPKPFTANRPFLYMVADGFGNIILNGIFMGEKMKEKKPEAQKPNAAEAPKPKDAQNSNGAKKPVAGKPGK